MRIINPRLRMMVLIRFNKTLNGKKLSSSWCMIPFLLTLTPADVHISHEIFSVPWNAHPTTGIRTCCTTGRFAPLAWPFVLDPWQSARTSSVPWHNQVKGTKYQFLPGYVRYIYILYTVYIYIYTYIHACMHTYTHTHIHSQIYHFFIMDMIQWVPLLGIWTHMNPHQLKEMCCFASYPRLAMPWPAKERYGQPIETNHGSITKRGSTRGNW